MSCYVFPILSEDLFLKNSTILGQKLGNLRRPSSEELFFLENTMILGKIGKSFFFEEHHDFWDKNRKIREPQTNLFSSPKKFFNWTAYVCPEFRLFRYGKPTFNKRPDLSL